MGSRLAGRHLSVPRVLALYHHPCHDGVFAALALHRYYAPRGTPVVWHPHTTYEPLVAKDLGIQSTDLVYLLDFTGPKGFVEELAQEGPCRIVVLDHHKTGKEELDRAEVRALDCLEAHFDMQRSGAMMALDYFQPQDADLWTWALPDSKAFHAGLNASAMEYDARKNPGIWAALEDLDPEALKLQGIRELAVQQVSRDRVLRTAFPIALPGPLRGQRGLATLLEDDDALGARIRSTLGNDLASRAAELEGFAAVGVVAYREAGMPSDALKLSFRSVGGLDVGAAAQAIGGGGHAAAAAGVVPKAVFEEMVQAAAADGK